MTTDDQHDNDIPALAQILLPGRQFGLILMFLAVFSMIGIKLLGADGNQFAVTVTASLVITAAVGYIFSSAVAALALPKPWRDTPRTGRRGETGHRFFTAVEVDISMAAISLMALWFLLEMAPGVTVSAAVGDGMLAVSMTLIIVAALMSVRKARALISTGQTEKLYRKD